MANVACHPLRIDAGQVAAHAVVERTAKRQEQRIENGAIELRRAVIGNQGIEAVADAGLDLLVVMRRKMAERRSGLAVHIGAGRQSKRQAQLLEIALVR
jgi:hypothetical protein